MSSCNSRHLKTEELCALVIGRAKRPKTGILSRVLRYESRYSFPDFLNDVS